MTRKNRNDEKLLESADGFNMTVENAFFKKDREKLIFYKSDGHLTVVDYVLVQRNTLMSK